MEENFDGDEELRMENEIKKLKLSLDFGADFNLKSDLDIPPHIEGQFLDYIKQFESAFKNKTQVIIYDFIGKPDFKLLDELNPDEITNELQRLMDILSNNGIRLISLAGIDDKDMYQFITEEFFKELTDDLRIEGLITNFSYEDFHPNHLYTIEVNATDFIKSILDKDIDLSIDFLCLAENIVANYGIKDVNEVMRKINLFRDSFQSFTIDDLQVAFSQINAEKTFGKISFNITYTAQIEGSNELQIFTGDCLFDLILELDSWNIASIEMPGINF